MITLPDPFSVTNCSQSSKLCTGAQLATCQPSYILVGIFIACWSKESPSRLRLEHMAIATTFAKRAASS